VAANEWPSVADWCDWNCITDALDDFADEINNSVKRGFWRDVSRPTNGQVD
jgi:hypothetical protein